MSRIRYVKTISGILILTLIFTLTAPVFGSGTAFAVSSDASMSDFSAVLYNNSNGLPTSEANAVVQSGNGFIYIGSYSGLIRYDGVNFMRFDSSTGITSVVSLCVDSKERLWVGTNDSGIALYEKDGTFTFFNKSAGLTSLSVRSITEDNNGNIIFGTTEGLGYIDGNNSVHMLTDSVIEAKYLKQMTRGSDGVIYGCTLDGVCFCLEDLKITHSFSSKDTGIGLATCITPSPEGGGAVLVGTDESTVVYGNILKDMKDCTSYSVLPNANINSICPASGGGFWICTDNGIGMLYESGNYAAYSDLPMNNSVEDMMTDYEGNVWFVSSRQGIMKIVHNEFSDISRLAGLENRVVNTTCLYEGDLYIGTDTGLQVVEDGNKKKTNYLTELLDGVRIRCIKRDSQNRLWLCTYSDNGLICYEGGENVTYYNTRTGLKSDRVRAMTELSDGTIATATSAGVVFIKDGKIVGTFDESNGIGNTEILTVCEGENDELYFGSDGGGIFIVNREGVVKQLGLEDGLRSEIIMRIKKDPARKGYWVITGNSLAYMENNSVKTLGNFPYSNNFDLFFDNIGRVWILSSSGIYAVSIDKLLSGEDIEYSFYDVKCGLPSVATANSRSCLSEDGTLYIAGMTGVSAVNINKEQEDRTDIKLAVPFVEIDDKTVTVTDGKTVNIPADCKRLTIYGYVLTFGLSNPRISYIMEGFDDNNVTLSRQELQPVSYTNLEHGEYTFRLAVINTITGEETESISVKFVKAKAFFEELWFWALMLLLVIAAALTALLMFARIKTRRLLKKQEEDRIFVNQIIRSFAKCIDFKDKYTNGHSFRVAKYAALIAERMGYTGQQVTDVYNIGLLHDVGKIAVPDSILGKPGRLTKEEFDIISRHAEQGFEILKEIETRPELAVGAGYHHEHIDGTGYPFGKKGDEIPEVAQIIAVADTFDAMNSTRPYRKQMKMEDIMNEMRRIAGTQLNARIVDVFLEIVAEGHIDDDIALADIVLPDEPIENT